MAITKQLRAIINDLESKIEEMETSPEFVRMAEQDAGIQSRDTVIAEQVQRIADLEEEVGKAYQAQADEMAKVASLERQLVTRNNAKVDVERRLAAVLERAWEAELDLSGIEGLDTPPETETLPSEEVAGNTVVEGKENPEG